MNSREHFHVMNQCYVLNKHSHVEETLIACAHAIHALKCNNYYYWWSNLLASLRVRLYSSSNCNQTRCVLPINIHGYEYYNNTWYVHLLLPFMINSVFDTFTRYTLLIEILTNYTAQMKSRLEATLFAYTSVFSNQFEPFIHSTQLLTCHLGIYNRITKKHTLRLQIIFHHKRQSLFYNVFKHKLQLISFETYEQ